MPSPGLIRGQLTAHAFVFRTDPGSACQGLISQIDFAETTNAE
jgi:hypothetical protein